MHHQILDRIRSTNTYERNRGLHPRFQLYAQCILVWRIVSFSRPLDYLRVRDILLAGQVQTVLTTANDESDWRSFMCRFLCAGVISFGVALCVSPAAYAGYAAIVIGDNGAVGMASGYQHPLQALANADSECKKAGGVTCKNGVSGNDSSFFIAIRCGDHGYVGVSEYNFEDARVTAVAISVKEGNGDKCHVRKYFYPSGDK